MISVAPPVSLMVVTDFWLSGERVESAASMAIFMSLSFLLVPPLPLSSKFTVRTSPCTSKVTFASPIRT